MPTLKSAVQWIALNDDIDIGDDETGYITSVCLVADLFDRHPHEIAWAVGIERAGRTWRLGRYTKRPNDRRHVTRDA
jgi:hypothetical protein